MTYLASNKPITLLELARMKREGEKIAMLTCYDASFAALEDRCGVDVVLVGDSLGNVIQGNPGMDHTGWATSFSMRCPAQARSSGSSAPRPGSDRPGAISANGASTKARSCRRGCGSVR